MAKSTKPEVQAEELNTPETAPEVIETPAVEAEAAVEEVAVAEEAPATEKKASKRTTKKEMVAQMSEDEEGDDEFKIDDRVKNLETNEQGVIIDINTGAEGNLYTVQLDGADIVELYDDEIIKLPSGSSASPIKHKSKKSPLQKMKTSLKKKKETLEKLKKKSKKEEKKKKSKKK